MRAWMLILVALPCLASCRGEPAPAVGGDGELVLELGGDNGSLARSLTKLGFELQPAALRVRVREPELEPQPTPQPTPEPEPEPEPEPTPEPTPGPKPADAQSHYEVALGEGETVMDIAKTHLGTSRRFLEILELNGWSDRDSRRLKVGVMVKVPVDPANPR